MMFEVTGSHIAALGDSDLRTLVARLAIAELRAQGCPVSAVTAGGNQDAKDGGLDVRVECPAPLVRPDFLPRGLCGFQVKKPDMPASEIQKEMRPNGVLRPVVGELAAGSGAYIIVSAQGSVADKPLTDRREAIRNQLHDLPSASQLHTDFYDRERLATWANEYPGISAWVLNAVGLGLAGWSSIGEWHGTEVAESGAYLLNDNTCVTDERSNEREQLSVGEGIVRIRTALRSPRQCVRLIGLSGVGKTRLVQALFETGVGTDPLDPSLAVYTDYSEQTTPTARDMARYLVATGQRAILVVDNCNPATHSELAKICAASGQVSLLSVEYDVREDEPERTDVFRLQHASPELVAQWLEQAFPNISGVDRRRIAEFSEGNFRVAQALADTLRRGETLGQLKSVDLFDRLFQQRNQPDQGLLIAARSLALLYSVDGENVSTEGELARFGRLANSDANEMYAALVELSRRHLVQARGSWRAILPQAIANPLARQAMERIPAPEFDRFCQSLPPRMQISLTRRLGYLHDSAPVRGAVDRLLRRDGPLGDLREKGDHGIKIISNLAPAAPDAVLAELEALTTGPQAPAALAPNAPLRARRISLLRHLAYEPEAFDRAAMALARFLAAEPADYRGDSAQHAFAELFHMHLSGTEALPAQRREFVRRLAYSADAGLRRCASIALEALLVSLNFTSSHQVDFGAKPRDWGWRPKVYGDVFDWYNGAIDLVLELDPVLDDASRILGKSVRGIWNYGGCHATLDKAATELSTKGPWLAGWFGFRSALSVKGEKMPAGVKKLLKSIVQRLQPTDLLNRARAVVLNRYSGGWDIADFEPDDGKPIDAWERASALARELGRLLAGDTAARQQFLPELFAVASAPRANECGQGLAEGAEDLSALWHELVVHFGATTSRGNPNVLGGFIAQAHRQDAAFVSAALEAARGNGAVASVLPYLQSCAGLTLEGIARLRAGIGRGELSANSFGQLRFATIDEAPADELAALLLDLGALPGGPTHAIEILQMYFLRGERDKHPLAPSLVEAGRRLLAAMEFDDAHERDYSTRSVLKVCCVGKDGAEAARQFCARMRDALDNAGLSHFAVSDSLKAIFALQPEIGLDALMLPNADGKEGPLTSSSRWDAPIDDVSPELLKSWADKDASVRYPLLGDALALFGRHDGEEDNILSTTFLELLEGAPDKRAFLGRPWGRVYPGGWSGSVVTILAKRREQIALLAGSAHESVRGWAGETVKHIDRWIAEERTRERRDEAGFE